ncbi:L-lactate dehydrogenase [Fructobacillus fructosus]|uniref:Malate/lactate dehydrogenase (Mdh) n=1 Tax=Fructobacillus fructosus TaxID=1631 RepID=A0ABM9MQ49_9LACO|nr:Malate/lactate dehydrogenase (Mdh) [Fructobacillus fructosus]CAK1235502.1 Malate/lactate dehydrogenase (Mdh) [Fructobacillus fructosus]CAK1239903.1 Malate/lactate dehydrogenase (Mdh) [Fructobacillus fructosus]CAK1240936.1 Malate/lactate dehydrogenase (Mdh) [Fructobacillus fructosus]CAK1242482.1 Malate/lactate dehydrogenase (Mdh) [Fructobacillus fructosus]
MRKVGIIGMGNVGSAVAHALIQEGAFDEYVLIDKREEKVRAEALDFEDAKANQNESYQITVNDYSALDDADVVISAIGKIELHYNNVKRDRFIELPFTAEQTKEVAAKLKATKFSGTLVVITNPCDAIAALYQKETGYPKEKVIATGTLLDTARMKRAVGAAFGVTPKSVSGYNLGEHGNSQFSAWSTVRVLEQPIKEIARERGVDLADIEEDSIRGGYTVFSGKKCTTYGIATAAVRLTKAVVSDSHEELVVSHYQDAYGTYLSTPAVVGRAGIVYHVPMALPKDEADKLQASADSIKTQFEKYAD